MKSTLIALCAIISLCCLIVDSSNGTKSIYREDLLEKINLDGKSTDDLKHKLIVNSKVSVQ